MKDSHGRTIDYLRISLTDRCNLRCIYCMPAEGVCSLSHDEILRIEEIERIVRVAADMGISRIRLTGGEPLVRKGVVDLIRAIKATPGIDSVALTTNGILLPRMAEELAEAGLSRVNISLDTLDPEQYTQITRLGKLEDALAGIDAALEAGFAPVKLNSVVVRSLDQDVFGFAKMSIDRPLHVRFIEYMPVGESTGSDGLGWGKKDVVASEELLARINEQAVEAGIGSRCQTHAQGLGSRPLLRIRERAGYGRVHLPSVQAFLQRMQPFALDRRWKDPPVPVLRHRIRCSHRSSRR